jgi:hypothetical protein
VYSSFVSIIYHRVSGYRIFSQIWPFGETNTSCDQPENLIRNLTPRFEANEIGAQVVQVVAATRSASKQMAPPPMQLVPNLLCSFLAKLCGADLHKFGIIRITAERRHQVLK